MRILRCRPGFQADHSSSSYLFYAVDGHVSAEGQRIAHQFSSRADVDKQFARYQKWGDNSLSSRAFPALLGEHYDVMASESYDSWTLMIAVPKTPAMIQQLQPFKNLDDGEFTRLGVNDYGKRLAIEIFCELSYEVDLEQLVKVLSKIRTEILDGDVSFLEAVAEFYTADFKESAVEEAPAVPAPAPRAEWTKAQLQEECDRRGIAYRKAWTKFQLRKALIQPVKPPPAARPARTASPHKLSRDARSIVDRLEHR